MGSYMSYMMINTFLSLSFLHSVKKYALWAMFEIYILGF